MTQALRPMHDAGVSTNYTGVMMYDAGVTMYGTDDSRHDKDGTIYNAGVSIDAAGVTM